MDHFVRQCYMTGQIESINRCRVYLQVLMLADITSADGKHIMVPLLSGHHLKDRRSTLHWPRQHNPSKADWLEWEKAIRSLCCGLQLCTPLDMTCIHTHQEWFWFIDDSRTLHQNTEGNWKSYGPPINSSCITRQGLVLTYSKLATSSCSDPPAGIHQASLDSITRSLIRVRGGPSTPPLALAHTNSPPRPSHSFVSLLTNHPFNHRLFSSADIPEDKAMALSSSISQGELVVCCDGSFNPLLHTGSYGTVFATKSSPLLEFSGPCNGSPHQLSAHRAELCSIVVTLKTILAVYKMYNCEGGSVSIYNDCSKAIKQIITPGWKFKRFLIDNYDLIGEAITLLQNLRQTNTINLLWVKGHYTGKQRELQHDLNARVHKIVTKFAQERPCPPATCEPPSTTGSIHLQHALTLKWQATVQEEYHKVLLQLTICKNAGWTDNIFSRVDWDALQRCLLKVPWVTRIGYCKLLHNLLNTNEQNCRYYKTSSICPCPKHFFTLQAAHMRTFSITTTPNKISYGRNWKSFGPPRLS
jgi:ribonuclease HI